MTEQLRVYVAVELPAEIVTKAALSEAFDRGFDYVVAPLVDPNCDATRELAVDAFTRTDLLLPSHQWSTCFVGKLSSWPKLDASDEQLRVRSERAFKQELAWAAHLSLGAVLLPTPVFPAANYARATLRVLSSLTFLQLFVRIPVCIAKATTTTTTTTMIGGVNPATSSSLTQASNDEALDCTTPWQWWNQFRVLCEHHGGLFVSLELTGDLPDNAHLLDHWNGEPVKQLIVPTSIFLTNKHGFPVLSQRHQAFVLQMARFRVQYVVSGDDLHNKNGLVDYNEYIRHLIARRPLPSEKDAFESSYRDFLQAPLQPLQDNLEAQTYETFERDPVKYVQYQEATRRALKAHGGGSDTVIVVMVVGAGRGPLVNAALRAAVDANRRVRVYAVEKNPNAIVTLMHTWRSNAEWSANVVVVHHDMRTWQAPEQADILVSELLGSFSDNESSPECLDGAQKFLKTNGISIPSQYTSFIAPCLSEKLFNEVRALGTERKHCETPYVVKLHNVHELAPPAPVFTFRHPTPQPANNNRYVALRFGPVTEESTIHGLAGYFEATLYDDVQISILPSTHSPGMFSWFPIWFPLRNPVAVRRGDIIELQMWRIVDDRRMHYEYALTLPHATPIHNVNARSYFVGL